MLVIPPKKLRRRDARPKARLGAPPTVNQIVRVTHGDDIDRLVVTLSRPLTSYDEIDQMFASSASGVLWHSPIGITNEDPLNLIFIMDVDVADNTLWRVPGPENYHFADGDLAEPFTGSIE
jgi:hypothetical protein